MDCALSLVRLAKERRIPGLQQLGDDLVTMETLVYETSCELSLTLKDLQQLSDIDKLHLLMKNVSGPFTPPSFNQQNMTFSEVESGKLLFDCSQAVVLLFLEHLSNTILV